MRHLLAISLAWLSVAFSPAAMAASIGVNFAANVGDTNQQLAATDATGVVPQAHWNNAYISSPSLSDLTDDQGTSTGASLAWLHTPISTPSGLGAPAYYLLSSGIGLDHDPSHIDVTVSQIPFAKYDVYLYFTHNYSGQDVVAYYLNYGQPSNDVVGVIQDVGNRDAFTNSWAYPIPPDYLTFGANYAKFAGIVGSTLTISGSSEQFGDLALDGFQIVEVPEPSSLALLCIGVVGTVGVTMFWRRKVREAIQPRSACPNLRRTLPDSSVLRAQWTKWFRPACRRSQSLSA